MAEIMKDSFDADGGWVEDEDKWNPNLVLAGDGEGENHIGRQDGNADIQYQSISVLFVQDTSLQQSGNGMQEQGKYGATS